MSAHACTLARVIAPLVLLGRLVTFDEHATVIDDGALYIGADELIAAVQALRAASGVEHLSEVGKPPPWLMTDRRGMTRSAPARRCR